MVTTCYLSNHYTLIIFSPSLPHRPTYYTGCYSVLTHVGDIVYLHIIQSDIVYPLPTPPKILIKRRNLEEETTHQTSTPTTRNNQPATCKSSPTRNHPIKHHQNTRCHPKESYIRNKQAGAELCQAKHSLS